MTISLSIRYLVYRTADDSSPQSRFKSEEFIACKSLFLSLSCCVHHLTLSISAAALPTEWQPFMREIVLTQSFSQFVDERVVMSKLDLDVIFFDESIDAKYNRYTFRLHSIDTPFLQQTHGKHFKTYVPPPPHTSDLDKTKEFGYFNRFPNLE